MSGAAFISRPASCKMLPCRFLTSGKWTYVVRLHATQCACLLHWCRIPCAQSCNVRLLLLIVHAWQARWKGATDASTPIHSILCTHALAKATMHTALPARACACIGCTSLQLSALYVVPCAQHAPRLYPCTGYTGSVATRPPATPCSDIRPCHEHRAGCQPCQAANAGRPASSPHGKLAQAEA